MSVRRALQAALILVLAAGCGSSQQPRESGVASAHPLATEAGIRILEAGGNAYDAAIATAAVLGVAEPYSSGLGGGGFWLLKPADGEPVVLDARETAPGEAHPELYLDAEGKVRDGKPSLNGALAAAIPGQPAALARLSREYGELPLERSLRPAIEVARGGFPVDERYRTLTQFRLEILRKNPATRARFLDDQGRVPRKGHMIRQPQLARTLETLARDGRDGFYEGDIARQLVREVRDSGGIWRQSDLADYAVIERRPRTIKYRDARILTAPAPSSGGIALGQLFGMLAASPLAPDAPRLERVHWLTEMMRRAYRDRAEHLGDPAFTDIPVTQLLDPGYLQDLVADIDPDTATGSGNLPGPEARGRHTSHLSVIDADGNAVSATLSINYPFGSGVTSGKTGILLNNEMDDFSIRPGTPNAYGLIGGEANKVEAGKRPLSSMSPIIMETPEAVTALGTPGGSRIITMNFLAALDAVRGLAPAAIVAGRRFHHQYLPDRLQHEPDTFSTGEKERLRALGHELENVGRRYGNMQLVRQNRGSGAVSGASDPRGIGTMQVLDVPGSQ